MLAAERIAADRAGAPPPELRPTLLCIGAAKAGTTWLAGALSAHPDVFIPPRKELNALHYADFDERLWDYAAAFKGGKEALARGDFSPRYLASPRAAARAASYAPEARILLIARNPIDQIQSHYWHLRRQNFHQTRPITPAPSLLEALDRFPELLLEPARYGAHYAAWAARFAPERRLVVRFETMIAAPAAALARICAFLSIEPRDLAPCAPKGGAAREGVSPKGGALGALYPPLYALGRRGLGAAKRVIGLERADALARRLRLRAMAERVFFEPGYAPVCAETRARLWQRLSGDAARFADLTGLDVSDWEPRP
ncbi:MAG: sulfotransferase [Pseudomonadota bacterium]